MGAADAFAKPWWTSESGTSVGELLPQSTSSIEETQRWVVWARPDPSSFILSMGSVQILDFFEPRISVFKQVESLTRWLVEEGVRLHNLGEIQDYIVEFPDLIEIIPQAVRATKKHLPEGQIVLEVYRDPEIEDRYLALYVRLQMYDEKVMERIEAAESEFLDLLAGKKGWLQLTTDFGKPEVR